MSRKTPSLQSQADHRPENPMNAADFAQDAPALNPPTFQLQANTPQQEEISEGETTQLATADGHAGAAAPPPFEDNSGNENPGNQKDKAPFQLKESPENKPNNTGLPDDLKAGVENLSGFSMDDVQVHYNSDKPAQLQAHAYAQGTDIHIGPGQEKHLPHEAWHVAQQKQGRVQTTLQMKGGVNVNDDTGLEREADVMGAKAMQNQSQSTQVSPQKATPPSFQRAQIQMMRGGQKTGTIRSRDNEEAISPFGSPDKILSRAFELGCLTQFTWEMEEEEAFLMGYESDPELHEGIQKSNWNGHMYAVRMQNYISQKSLENNEEALTNFLSSTHLSSEIQRKIMKCYFNSMVDGDELDTREQIFTRLDDHFGSVQLTSMLEKDGVPIDAPSQLASEVDEALRDEGVAEADIQEYRAIYIADKRGQLAAENAFGRDGYTAVEFELEKNNASTEDAAETTQDLHHKVYVTEEGLAIVESTPVPVESLTSPGATWCQIQIPANTQLKLKDAKVKIDTAYKNFNQGRTKATYSALSKALNEVAVILSGLLSNSPASASYPTPKDLSNQGVQTAEKVAVENLNLKMGTGSGPKDSPFMGYIRQRAGADSKYYKQMHLLNDNIGGKGEFWNLTPGPAASNSEMEKKIEDPLKRAIIGKGLVLDFIAEAEYSHNPNTADPNKVKDNPGLYTFNKITIEVYEKGLDSANNWVRKPKDKEDDTVKKIRAQKQITWKDNGKKLIPKPSILLANFKEEELIAAGVPKSASEKIFKARFAIQNNAKNILKTGDGSSRIENLWNTVRAHENLKPSQAPTPNIDYKTFSWKQQ